MVWKNLVIAIFLFCTVTCIIFFDDIANIAFQRDIAPKWVQIYGEERQLASYYHFVRRHSELGDMDWLKASVKLSQQNPTIAAEIANFYDKQGREELYLFWLNNAAQNGNEKALVELVNYYWQYQQYDKAERLLSIIPDNKALLELAVASALIEGNKNNYLQRINRLSRHYPNAELLNVVSHFSIFEQQLVAAKSCPINIQPIATRLADLSLLLKHIETLASSQISNFVCFEKPLYQPIESLHCFHQESERIQCKINVWQTHSLTDVNYLLVMYPKGGANVNHGIIYIDQKDTTDVLVHELLHTLGFVDEYPLPSNHQRCAQEQKAPFAHNIAVLEDKVYLGERESVREQILQQLPWRERILASTPILKPEGQGWRLGTDKEKQNNIGLFPARTCLGKRQANQENNNKILAFKPLNVRTKLEYFELDTPALYWQLLRNNTHQYLMPSHLVNKQMMQ
ncbi:tetratricopeptide repeat protein [Thalassotalea sediminis]|uniref:tetratricopeptide repeat protein n=1 Tax=Thalassotalea sediminis TaxID=1759089 RepID=UPI0025727893|nr:M64 family metallopeptidase [Thalassotalea sediminis]